MSYDHNKTVTDQEAVILDNDMQGRQKTKGNLGFGVFQDGQYNKAIPSRISENGEIFVASIEMQELAKSMLSELKLIRQHLEIINEISFSDNEIEK